MITQKRKEWAERVFRSFSPTELKDMVGDALLAACLNSLIYLKTYNISPTDEDIDPLQGLKIIYDYISELVDDEEADQRLAN